MRARYDVGFHVMQKVLVNGRDAHEVYRWLRLGASEDRESAPYLGWNFCMFCVGRDGRTILRPHAQVSPFAFRTQIEEMLKEPS